MNNIRERVTETINNTIHLSTASPFFIRTPTSLTLDFHSFLLKSSQDFPLAVSLAAFSADTLLFLHRFHYSFHGAKRFSGGFGRFLLFDILIFEIRSKNAGSSKVQAKVSN